MGVAGILYSREAIVESLLAQKKAIKEKQAAYRRYLNEKESKKDRVERHERDLEVMALYSKQMGASDAAIDRLKRDSRKEYEKEELGKEVVASVKTIKSEAKKMESLKSYWISGTCPILSVRWFAQALAPRSHLLLALTCNTPSRT